MSDFVQQNKLTIRFDTSNSWVILTPIEQSIKSKIEAIGTPLKDWDIQINYGIKTGLNDAFIISTEKRKEILAGCADEEERARTAELIRPILRGRDIKRYGYDWAGLYLIATFPSRHYDLEAYPSIKKYLTSFGIERLEQTGKSYLVKNQKIKARKKTNNKWFETQDSIRYWDDFNKPKIIWKIIGSNLAFSFDNDCVIVNNACYLMTGTNIKNMLPFLNSKIINWYSDITNMNPTGVGDAQVGAQNIGLFPIPKEGIAFDINYNNIDNLLIEKEVARVYGLTDEELDYILSIYPISSSDN